MIRLVGKQIVVDNDQNPDGTSNQGTGAGTKALPSILIVDTSGVVPFTVHATLIGANLEELSSVTWHWGDGSSNMNDPITPIQHTYEKEGVYSITVQYQNPDDSYSTVDYSKQIVVSAAGSGTLPNPDTTPVTKTASLFSSPIAMILLAGAAVGILFSRKKKGKSK